MEQPRMGTLPDKKYPQVVTRQEVAFLVMGYLKEEKFKQTLEIFEKEAKSVIKNMKLASKKVKNLHSILNEFIFLKIEEKKKTNFINTFGQDPSTKQTMQKLHALLEDYSMYREAFLPQRPQRDISKLNKNSTGVYAQTIANQTTAHINTSEKVNMNIPITMMQIDLPNEPQPSFVMQSNNHQNIVNNNIHIAVDANNISSTNTNTRPVPQLPVIEVFESPAPKQIAQQPAEQPTLNNNNVDVTSNADVDNASALLSPTMTNIVLRTPIASTPRRKPKPRKYSPLPKAKQSLNFDADQDANQVHDEMSREFMESGFKLLMQNQPLQQKIADLINSRLTSPEPVIADDNEIPPNAIDEILNSLTADPMFEPLFHSSDHVDALNLSHQSNDSHSSNNINPAAHQTFDSNPNNKTIAVNMSNTSNTNNNVDRDASFERLNTSTDNLLNFNTFGDKSFQTNSYAHNDEIDFAALLNTSTEEVDPHVQNTASFFHSILQSTETLTPLNEELDSVHSHVQSGESAHHTNASNNSNNNTNATMMVRSQIDDKNEQRHVSTEWRNYLNNSTTINTAQNTDSNTALIITNNSNSSDENSKSKTSQRRKQKLSGTKRTASTLGSETDQQNKKQKLEETKLPDNLDVELFLSQLNYK